MSDLYCSDIWLCSLACNVSCIGFLCIWSIPVQYICTQDFLIQDICFHLILIHQAPSLPTIQTIWKLLQYHKIFIAWQVSYHDCVWVLYLIILNCSILCSFHSYWSEQGTCELCCMTHLRRNPKIFAIVISNHFWTMEGWWSAILMMTQMFQTCVSYTNFYAIFDWVVNFDIYIFT